MTTSSRSRHAEDMRQSSHERLRRNIRADSRRNPPRSVSLGCASVTVCPSGLLSCPVQPLNLASCLLITPQPVKRSYYGASSVLSLFPTKFRPTRRLCLGRVASPLDSQVLPKFGPFILTGLSAQDSVINHFSAVLYSVCREAETFRKKILPKYFSITPRPCLLAFWLRT